ncbi:MAG: DUF805 domain-containing protein [Pseudomonadota bacterium]
MQFIAILKASCNPAGRINRTGFLYLALIILGIQVATYGMTLSFGLQAESTVLRVFDLATLWICLTAAAKRLHDTGRGAIWILYAVAGSLAFSVLLIMVAVVTLGPTVLQPQNPLYIWIVSLATVPAFGATLWLHFAKGDVAANRFGPTPDHTGFSQPPNDESLMSAAVDR